GKLMQAGKLRVADETLYEALYLQAQQTLGASGFVHYEVSNYARPGRESKHNSHYWEGGDYIGVGVGAVGKIQNARGQAVRWKNATRIETYLGATHIDAHCQEKEELSARTLMQEALMLGLRTAQGCNVNAVQQDTGLEITHERHAEIA